MNLTPTLKMNHKNRCVLKHRHGTNLPSPDSLVDCIFSQFPFAQTWTTTLDSLLDVTGDDEMGVLRDDVGADLVQIVHDFDDGSCGRA